MSDLQELSDRMNGWIYDELAETLTEWGNDKVPYRLEVSNSDNEITIQFRDKQDYIDEQRFETLECTRCDFEQTASRKKLKWSHESVEFDSHSLNGKYIVCPDCGAVCSPELTGEQE